MSYYDYDSYDYDCDDFEDAKERWYVEGAESDRDYWNTPSDPWEDVWVDELDRRELEENLPQEEKVLLRIMSDEKALGAMWRCGTCNTGYRVKKPFENLFCPQCLGRLEAYRYLPGDNPKVGYWMLDDASDFECEQIINTSRREEDNNEEQA